MYFTQLATGLASLSLSSAALLPRQTAASAASNFTKLGGWVESLTIRPNGNLLLNRLDVPELWTIDPSTKAASKLLSFEGALGCTGITELTPDVYAVVTGNFSTTSFALGSGSYAVYKVDMTGSTPKTSLVKKLPDAGFVIGITPFSSDTIFMADAGKGALLSMNVTSGDYTTVLTDSKMKAPNGSFINEGIHGLKYRGATLYFTNTFGNTFNKVPIVETTGKAAGGVVTINTGIDGPEDFILGPDGSALIASYNNNALMRVTPEGKLSVVANVTSPSSVAHGRKESDRNMLYISTATGQILTVTAS